MQLITHVSAPPVQARPRLRLQVSVEPSSDGAGWIGYVHRKKTSHRTWIYAVFAPDRSIAKLKAQTWMEYRLNEEGRVHP